MSDRPAILRAILSDPADDTARLVYADWFEEHDEPARAELIRVQIELARAPASRGRHASVLRKRQEAILGTQLQTRRDWALPAEVDETRLGWEWRRGFPEVWHCPVDLWVEIGPAIASVNPVLQVVTECEPEGAPSRPSLFRRSWYRHDESQWANPPGEKSMIPSLLFDLLPADPFDLELLAVANTYPTSESALAALSDACVEYARSRAGLPSLMPFVAIP